MHEPSTEARPPVRAIHLDLKGLPPRFDRLLRWLEIFAAAHYNAVLVEWEDMLPWNFDPRVRSDTCYSASEVARFLDACRALNIEVIPLVQCLGHMESVLQIEDYAPLRELPGRTDCLNPLAPGAGELVGRMVDDVLSFHDQPPRYLHLGGDEAWAFGSHPDTKAFIAQHGPAALYLRHIDPLLSRLEKAGIRPILWHDMMIEWEDESLRALGRRADLMAWGYRGSPDQTDHHHRRAVLDRLHGLDVPLWGAGAFKGADGPQRDLPDREARLDNMLGWAQVAGPLNLRGIAATGWSRYATARTQTEPFDAALDVAVLSGLVLHEGKMPEAGWDAATDLLRSLGEADRVEALQAVLRAVQDQRDVIWLRIRQLDEHLAGLAVDPSRNDGGMAGFLVGHMDRAVERLEELADAARPLLDEVTLEPWSDHYLATWVRSLRDMAASIQTRVQKLEA